MAEGRPSFPLPSLPSDVALPPYARRLDVRATRAAFAAGTLGTVGDDPSGEDVKRDIEVRHLDGYDSDVMHADILAASEVWAQRRAPTEDEFRAEALRQSRLRRWQTPR